MPKGRGFTALFDKLTKTNGTPEQLQSLERLQSLQSLESLEEKITVLHLSYDEVKIPKNSVVYCDPPYRDTAQDGYNGDTFDFKTFDNWLDTVDFPVYVSEYTEPPNVKEIASFDKNNTFGATTPKKVQEKLFIQERFFEQYEKEQNPTPKLNLHESKGE